MKTKLRNLCKTFLKLLTVLTGLFLTVLSGGALMMGAIPAAAVALLTAGVLFLNAFYRDIQ